MKQSKLESFVEAKVNMLVGMLVSYILGLIVYPIFGFNVTHTQNLTIMVIFTLASLIRTYAIRRIFNRRV